METISFIIKLLTAITLLIFLIILTFDTMKQHSIKIAYSRLACNLTLIAFSVADLIIHIITKDKLVLAIIIPILWIANLLLCISSIKSRKKIICADKKIEELESKIKNPIDCQ